jgi:hypothetical protein
VLCQGLADALGDANKVENIITDALEGYVAHKNGVVKDNFDKLSGLMVLSGFETTLMQIMLKEIYCRDKKSMDKYENIRKTAAMKMEHEFGKIHAGQTLELQETVRTLSNELERVSNQNQVLMEEKTALQEKYQYVSGKLTTSERNYNDMAVALKSYIKLNEWQELRIKEVPKIRKKNSGIIRVQTWESAIKDFGYYNQKPAVQEFDIK